MSERSITRRLDFEVLRHAIERSDPDSMLELYAQDAVVRVLGGGALSFEVQGKAEVAKYLRAVHARSAIHRVENDVVDEGHIRFEESCEYPDGSRTVVETRLEVRGAEISRQIDVVICRDKRSGEPEKPADLDLPSPNGEGRR